jgi:hypothetical protein
MAYKTDEGREIKTVPDSWPWPWPFPPTLPPPPPPPPWYTEDVARDRTITEENNAPIVIGGITTTIGALISSGVITPTVITPTDSYDCWGWTFTCGHAVVESGIEVQKIISDNGYAPVTSTNTVHVGALVVYRKNGEITHTGVVRDVQKSDGTRSRTYCNYGTPTTVESKRGRWGQYEHPPLIVPDEYGTPEYYQPPNRRPPRGPGSTGKEQHTLKQ